MSIAVLLLLLFPLSTASAKPHRVTIQDAEKRIDSVINATEGKFAVAFVDLQTGNTLYRHANEKFQAASTIKTPVMIEVFNQARKGKFALDDSLDIVNEFTSIVDGSKYSLAISSDSDDGLYSRIGKKEQIRVLVFHMITVSSNLAANLLIQKVGTKNIQRTMKALGVGDIHVLRCVEDDKAFLTGKNNTVTAKSLAMLYIQLARKSILSRKASGEMLDILLEQKFRNMIPAKLPASLNIAHKTGSSPGVQHDSGIIYLPDGRKYVLVVLSKNLREQKSGSNAIAEISKIIFDYETN
ncbi:MAG: serine hydrolase [Bacteroidota bacterium]